MLSWSEEPLGVEKVRSRCVILDRGGFRAAHPDPNCRQQTRCNSSETAWRHCPGTMLIGVLLILHRRSVRFARSRHLQRAAHALMPNVNLLDTSAVNRRAGTLAGEPQETHLLCDGRKRFALAWPIQTAECGGPTPPAIWLLRPSQFARHGRDAGVRTEEAAASLSRLTSLA